METLIEYWPFLIPLLLVQLLLMVLALVHIFKHPDTRYGSRGLWVFIVIIFQFVGPVLYFILGRGEDV